MCTVVHGDCACHGGGFGAAEFVATLTGLAVAGAGYVLLETFWPLALVAWLATAALASKRVRASLWRGARWLGREMWHTWTTRHERPAMPGQTVAIAQPWHVALYARDGQGMHELVSGVVAGAWSSAAEVEAEAMRRYVAEVGRPAGQLCCRAEPVAAP